MRSGRSGEHDAPSGVAVNVKMSQEDFDLLKKAAEKRWPDAVMSNSGIVLGLAKIAARQTLGKKK